jgi:hypothetical protein
MSHEKNYYSHITTGYHMKKIFPYQNRMSHEKYYYSHITTGCHMKRTTIPISQQDVT